MFLLFFKGETILPLFYLPVFIIITHFLCFSMVIYFFYWCNICFCHWGLSCLVMHIQFFLIVLYLLVYFLYFILKTYTLIFAKVFAPISLRAFIWLVCIQLLLICLFLTPTLLADLLFLGVLGFVQILSNRRLIPFHCVILYLASIFNKRYLINGFNHSVFLKLVKISLQFTFNSLYLASHIAISTQLF